MLTTSGCRLTVSAVHRCCRSGTLLPLMPRLKKRSPLAGRAARTADATSSGYPLPSAPAAFGSAESRLRPASVIESPWNRTTVALAAGGGSAAAAGDIAAPARMVVAAMNSRRLISCDTISSDLRATASHSPLRRLGKALRECNEYGAQDFVLRRGSRVLVSVEDGADHRREKPTRLLILIGGVLPLGKLAAPDRAPEGHVVDVEAHRHGARPRQLGVLSLG